MNKNIFLCGTMIFLIPTLADASSINTIFGTVNNEVLDINTTVDATISGPGGGPLDPNPGLQGWGAYNLDGTVADGSKIITSGSASDAIMQRTSKVLTIGDGLYLRTEGSSADGINLAVSGGSTLTVGNYMTVETESGVGIRANLSTVSNSGNVLIVGNDANITTEGAGNNTGDSLGYAVYAGNRDRETVGIPVAGSAKIQIGNNSHLSTSGNNAYAVYANKTGVIQLGSTTITTSGNNAHGIIAESGSIGQCAASGLSSALCLALGSNLTNITDYEGGKIYLTGDTIVEVDSSKGSYAFYSSGAGSLIGSSDSYGNQTSSVYTVRGDMLAEKGGEISLSMTDNSFFQGSTEIDNVATSKLNLVIDGSNSVWDITKDSSLTSLKLTNGASLLAHDVSNPGASNYTLVADSVENGGVIDLSNNTTGDAFTIRGKYISNGGFLKLDNTLSDDNSPTDKLIIDGNVTTGTKGSTKVSIKNLGGTGAATIEGIQVVNVINGTSSADAFIKDGRIVAGAYDYDVVKGNTSGTDTESWYLTSYLTPVTPNPPTPPEHIVRPEGGSYLGNLVAANTMFNLRLHDRLGETQYTDLLTGEQKVTSMWLRYQYGKTKFKAATGQLNIKNDWNITQLGGDLAQWTTDGTNRLHLGAMVGYGRSTNDSTSGLTGYKSEGVVDGYSLGVYGTWYDNEADKTGLYVDTWVLWNDFSASVHGEGLDREKYDLSGFTASAESGYTFLAKKADNYSFWLQPKAQLTWMGVDADNHIESNGTKVKGKGDNLQTRLGLRATLSTGDRQNLEIDRSGQIFVEANWLYNTSPFEVKLDDVKVQQRGARNIGELKSGVEWNLHKNTSAWVNIAYQKGDYSYENLGLMIGAKYAF